MLKSLWKGGNLKFCQRNLLPFSALFTGLRKNFSLTPLPLRNVKSSLLIREIFLFCSISRGTPWTSSAPSPASLQTWPLTADRPSAGPVLRTGPGRHRYPAPYEKYDRWTKIDLYFLAARTRIFRNSGCPIWICSWTIHPFVNPSAMTRPCVKLFANIMAFEF